MDLGLERIQPVDPELAIPVQPAVDLAQRSGSTAYSRRVPSTVTVANPLSRSTRRCWETAGWLIPNSAPIGGDAARRRLAVGQQLQDPAPDRVAEDVERVHLASISVMTYMNKGLVRPDAFRPVATPAVEPSGGVGSAGRPGQRRCRALSDQVLVSR